MGIFILSSLLPKIYPFLETFPSICASYFEGLNRFFDIIIEIEGELRNIPSELMNCILYTLRVGLTSFTSCSDVQSICLTIITNLGRSISTDTGNAIEFNLLIVQPFLKLLIEIIFSLDLLQYNKLECFGAIYTLR